MRQREKNDKNHQKLGGCPWSRQHLTSSPKGLPKRKKKAMGGAWGELFTFISHVTVEKSFFFTHKKGGKWDCQGRGDTKPKGKTGSVVGSRGREPTTLRGGIAAHRKKGSAGGGGRKPKNLDVKKKRVCSTRGLGGRLQIGDRKRLGSGEDFRRRALRGKTRPSKKGKGRGGVIVLEKKKTSTKDHSESVDWFFTARDVPRRQKLQKERVSPHTSVFRSNQRGILRQKRFPGLE